MGEYKNFCSYFIKEKALFGGFPSQEQADILVNMGVKYFIDLTFPTEVPKKYNACNDCFYLNYPYRIAEYLTMLQSTRVYS